MKLTPTLLLAAAALSVTLPAAGQVPPSPTQPSPAATSRSRSESPDMEFVKRATEGGMRQIEAGKLASEKASSIEVRAFAKHMVDAHTNSNAELKAVVSLPPSATAQKPRADDTLGGLTGEAFDRAYLTRMVQDHQAAIDLFEAEVRDGRDWRSRTGRPWSCRRFAVIGRMRACSKRRPPPPPSSSTAGRARGGNPRLLRARCHQAYRGRGGPDGDTTGAI